MEGLERERLEIEGEGERENIYNPIPAISLISLSGNLLITWGYSVYFM